ncbi:hypothetical protein M8J77_005008 [Diaphorina citri]|nr:hypothetical protein M8J77_005008 [Diaphorina citri]
MSAVPPINTASPYHTYHYSHSNASLLKKTTVMELFASMRDQSVKSQNPSTSNLTSLCQDISPSSSHFFENEKFKMKHIQAEHPKTIQVKIQKETHAERG